MTDAAVATLWEAYRTTADPDAREQLILHHLPLAKYIAGRMKMKAPRHVEEEDLLGWGILGLIDAVERFEPDRDLQFTTYASFRIRGAIIDQLRTLDWAPRSLRAKARKLEAARQHLLGSLGRPPAEGELADELGMTADEVFTLETDLYGAYVLSLDGVVATDRDGEGPVTLHAFTQDRRTPSPLDATQREEVVSRLADALAALPTQERHVIVLYYEEELTLKEIGVVMSLSESRICQIHRKAMRTLRAVADA